MPSHRSIPEGLRQKLWPHQIDAIEFGLRTLDSLTDSVGLIRMPTATGKTGVIATITVACAPTRWSLILSPWSNLCEQMSADVKARFWKTVHFAPSKIPVVDRLYPSNVETLSKSDGESRVIVATFATLVTIYKQNDKAFAHLAAKLGQVLIDEGHYEPAVEWGQAVKTLEKPTLLLTATPYRNDLKLFRIPKTRVYHFTHRDAELEKIVRTLRFKAMKSVEPTSTAEIDAWCQEFANLWKNKGSLKLPVSKPRAIICCSSFAMVKHAASALRKRGVQVLGIHERFAGTKSPYLSHKVPLPTESSASVWVHQHKLTEGLDDSRFCVIAIMNRIGNDRKLIQQIGRALRQSGNTSRSALVLYSAGLNVEQSWTNYRDFEKDPGDMIDPNRYYRVLDAVLKSQPAKEYFAGKFRSKFDHTSDSIANQILLSPTAIVRHTLPTFDWNKFCSYVTDFLFLEDRVVLGPRKEEIKVDADTVVWVYAVIGNSTILTQQSQYEIRLGALAASRIQEFLFLSDTEGLYPNDFLFEHSSKISPADMARVFPSDVKPSEVGLRNPWPVGPLLKRVVANAEDLRRTAVQLTDGTLICTALRGAFGPGTAGRRRQYLGFTRGRVSEQLQREKRKQFGINEFQSWIRELAGHLRNDRRVPSAYFGRFLQPVSPPDSIIPAFVTFDFIHQGTEVDLAWTDEDSKTVRLEESVIAVTENTEKRGDFYCHLAFVSDSDKPVGSVDLKVAYEPKRERFRFDSGEAASCVIATFPDREPEGLVTFLNNRDETFVVALKDPKIFYADQAFYEINYNFAEATVDTILDARADLKGISSEKGDSPKASWKRWPKKTVFGLIDDRGKKSILASCFGALELLFCDDMDTEACDFVCANFRSRKLAFVHAKCAHSKRSASALHDVVAQAIKNLNVSTRAGEVPSKIKKWTRSEKWNNTKIARWRIGSSKLPEKEALWSKIRSEILDHSRGQKEVWLVLGDTLEKADLMNRIKGTNPRTAETGQIIYLLSNLNALCRQVGATLRVLCH